ncbi:AAA family ATPase [Rhizobium sp. S152]|uniref:AAA family ATPase n=1 Tax=Rhizobium sp. S152 TaxID=3055038 RepID=UPI0025AA0686|nr:AAA family ATPase [Rhizobium sp. S152]MDM9627836.1 AAA family ATPase [Rhizobium sp. S152]
MAFPNRARLLEPNVERVVYSLGIRRALGDLGAIAYLRRPIAVLRLPKGADEKGYLDAAMMMMLAAPKEEQARVLAPRRDRRGALNFDEIMLEVAEERGLVVLVEDPRAIPGRLRAAADVVADIAPVAAVDLRTAAEEVLGLSLTDRQARRLLTLPLEAMLAAMRPGRSVRQIVNAVGAIDVVSQQSRPDENGPRLETLGGYGEARRWGLDLAEDVGAWRDGQIAWSEVDAGLLLSGPPGTGKTLYAAALARSCDLAFVPTSVARWQATGHLGDLLAAMRASFKMATERAPALLFIDEFDSIGDRARFSADHASYSTQVVNGLLECIDGSSRREGVVVVGATNNPDAIDPAFLRQGRLGRHIRIPLPAIEDRATIADAYLNGALSAEELRAFAAATEGMSGADIEGVVREARRRARRSKVRLDGGLVLASLPPALPLVGHERWIVSVHEAGHAVVGLALELGDLQSVGIVAEVRATQTSAGGAHFQSAPKIVRSRQSYLDEICLRLGGIAAERVFTGSVTDGAGAGVASDIAVASDMATRMVSEFGMGGALRHLHTPGFEERRQLRIQHREIEMEVASLLSEQLDRAEAIIRERMAVVDAVARLIVQEGALSGKVVVGMMWAGEEAAK